MNEGGPGFHFDQSWRQVKVSVAGAPGMSRGGNDDRYKVRHSADDSLFAVYTFSIREQFPIFRQQFYVNKCAKIKSTEVWSFLSVTVWFPPVEHIVGGNKMFCIVN